MFWSHKKKDRFKQFWFCIRSNIFNLFADNKYYILVVCSRICWAFLQVVVVARPTLHGQKEHTKEFPSQEDHSFIHPFMRIKRGPGKQHLEELHCLHVWPDKIWGKVKRRSHKNSLSVSDTREMSKENGTHTCRICSRVDTRIQQKR